MSRHRSRPPPTSTPSTTASSTAPAISAATTSEPATTTTVEPTTGLAWTTQEAERHVTNYLAALAAGAYEQAAWSAENNGIALDGQANDETPADFLRRSCDEGRCNGPYVVAAAGPGIVDPSTAQAASEVTGRPSSLR